MKGRLAVGVAALVVAVAGPAVAFSMAGDRQPEFLLLARPVVDDLDDTADRTDVAVGVVGRSWTDDPEDPAGQAEIAFSAVCVDPGGCGGPAAVRWDLGDGTTVTGQPTLDHRYRSAGRYDARVLVATDEGAGAASLPVRVARRYADVDGRTDADPLRRAAAAGTLAACRAAHGLDEADGSDALDRLLLCPAPDPDVGAGLTTPSGDPYDPTDCGSGFRVVNVEGQPALAAGVPEGCATPADLTVGLLSAVGLTDGPAACDTASDGFTTAEILGWFDHLDDACDSNAPLSKLDAYATLGLTAGLAGETTLPTALTVDVDADDQGGLQEGTPRRGPLAADLLAAGMPLVGTDTCDADDCLRPDEPLTRADLAVLLAAADPDAPASAPSVVVAADVDGDDGSVTVDVDVAAGAWLAGANVSFVWPDGPAGAIRTCDELDEVQLDSDGRVTATCGYGAPPLKAYPLVGFTVEVDVEGLPSRTAAVAVDISGG